MNLKLLSTFAAISCYQPWLPRDLVAADSIRVMPVVLEVLLTFLAFIRLRQFATKTAGRFPH
jgi:hypothetical protein